MRRGTTSSSCHHSFLLRIVIIWPLVVASKASLSSSLLWQLPKGSTAIVTGGTKGIGNAIVTMLASTFGCRVLTCSRSSEDLDKCLQGPWKGLNVEGIVADVSTPSGREALIQKAKELFGNTNDNKEEEECLDILVNNVGTNIRKATIDYSLEDTHYLLNANFVSMLELSKLCYPLFKKKHTTTRNSSISSTTATSSIVNIGSVGGVTCIKTGTPYAATKAAMNQITGNLGEL